MLGSPSMNRSSRLTQLPFGSWRFARAATSSARQLCSTPLASTIGRLTEQGHRLGERLVVVIKASLALSGVLVERVVLADVFQGGLDPRVILRQSGVDHALESRVGHPGIGTQSSVASGPCSLAAPAFGGLARVSRCSPKLGCRRNRRR